MSLSDKELEKKFKEINRPVVNFWNDMIKPLHEKLRSSIKEMIFSSLDLTGVSINVRLHASYSSIIPSGFDIDPECAGESSFTNSVEVGLDYEGFCFEKDKVHTFKITDVRVSSNKRMRTSKLNVSSMKIGTFLLTQTEVDDVIVEICKELEALEPVFDDMQELVTRKMDELKAL